MALLNLWKGLLKKDNFELSYELREGGGNFRRMEQRNKERSPTDFRLRLEIFYKASGSRIGGCVMSDMCSAERIIHSIDTARTRPFIHVTTCVLLLLLLFLCVCVCVVVVFSPHIENRSLKLFVSTTLFYRQRTIWTFFLFSFYMCS